MTAAKKTNKLDHVLSLMDTAVTLASRNAWVVHDYSDDAKLNYVFNMAAELIKNNNVKKPETATVKKAEDSYVRTRFLEMAATLVKPLDPVLRRNEAEIARDTVCLGKGLYDRARQMNLIKVSGAKPR